MFADLHEGILEEFASRVTDFRTEWLADFRKSDGRQGLRDRFYVRRFGIKPETLDSIRENQKPCEDCGRMFGRSMNGGGPEKRFCSLECNRNACVARRRRARNSSREAIRCKGCQRHVEQNPHGGVRLWCDACAATVKSEREAARKRANRAAGKLSKKELDRKFKKLAKKSQMRETARSAAELRSQGKTYQEIAEAMGVSKLTAFYWVRMGSEAA